jgi:hypothetical protein
MKKIFFSLTVIAIFCLKGQAATCASFTNYSYNPIKDGKKMEITIGANRASGEMQLRFTTGKPGKAAITVFNESGAIVLQQTDEVTNNINIIPLKNATRLTEGSYKVRLILNNETYITRFMIWN